MNRASPQRGVASLRMVITMADLSDHDAAIWAITMGGTRMELGGPHDGGPERARGRSADCEAALHPEELLQLILFNEFQL